MIRKTIKVSDNNFRKFDDPLGNETPRKYIFYAKTCDVPEGIPMSTNPRDQKLNSTVENAITESLLSNDGQFHLKNRGIILSAKRVRYDNRLQEVTIDFEDESCHSNIDGGHTYKILLENKDKVLEQYVQFEVMLKLDPAAFLLLLDNSRSPLMFDILAARMSFYPWSERLFLSASKSKLFLFLSPPLLISLCFFGIFNKRIFRPDRLACI